MSVRATKKWTFGRDKWSLRSRGRGGGVRERFCPECERPYDPAPRPKEDEQFVSRSAAAMVYSTSRYGRSEFTVRVGRWQAHANHLCLSGLFGPDDLDDLAKVAAMARDYIDVRTCRAPETSRFAARGQAAALRR